MAVQRGLVAVMLGTMAVGVAYASALLSHAPPGWAPWSMVLGIALLCTGSIALGGARPGRKAGGLGWALVAVFLILVACFGAALVLPAAEGPGAKLLLGLPVRAAVVLYGIGFIPALILPIVYARTFRDSTLSAADLERIRAARTADGEQ